MSRQKSILATKKARLALPVSKKPTFEALGDGVNLGYRRNADGGRLGGGSWVVRVADGRGGSWQRVIGIADDYAEADGEKVLTWGQAGERAWQAARAGREQDAPEVVEVPPTTVAVALYWYETDLKNRNGDVGNVSRLRAPEVPDKRQKQGHYLPETIMGKGVADLTVIELEKWKNSLKADLAPATINRMMNGLKAALSHAADRDDRITSRRPWEIGLKTLPNAETARNVILTDGDVAKLVKAAYGQSPEVGRLIHVAAETGARVSQIAALRVDDLHNGPSPSLAMPVSKKGRGAKEVSRRKIPISAALAKALVEAAGGRPGDAPLLLKPTGAPWAKSDHDRYFERTLAAAELTDPEGVTMYALRHSSIVRQLLRNVPIRVAAANHDTSASMIERNYSKHITDHSDAVARAALVAFAGG